MAVAKEGFYQIIKRALAERYYFATYYPQMGLYKDDYRRETPDIKEALRRIEKTDRELVDARSFRITRAFELSASKRVLPRDQWITIEENWENGFYLEPTLSQVRKEMAEKAEWEKRG